MGLVTCLDQRMVNISCPILRWDIYQCIYNMYMGQQSHPKMGLTISAGGSGFLPRQRLERVHVAFLNTGNLSSGMESRFRRRGITPEPRTTSRHSELSPAMFPSAQTAWRNTREGSTVVQLSNCGLGYNISCMWCR